MYHIGSEFGSYLSSFVVSFHEQFQQRSHHELHVIGQVVAPDIRDDCRSELELVFAALELIPHIIQWYNMNALYNTCLNQGAKTLS